MPLSSARGRAKADDPFCPDLYRLASLLRLTDVYAPPVAPREKVRSLVSPYPAP